MIEEIGKDIDSRLGRVIEVDKQSWEANQAKFMWVRVDLPIDKPLSVHLECMENVRSSI